MELVVILLIVALAVVLIAGGLFLSRRSTRTDRGVPEAPTRPTPTRPVSPPPVVPPEVTTAPEPEVVEPEVVEPEVVERVKPRLRDRLGKTRAAFAGAFSGIAGRGKVDDETWDELEEALILADVGVPTTTKVIDAVRERAKAEKTGDPRACHRAAPRGARDPARRRRPRAAPRRHAAERLDVRGRQRRGEDHEHREARAARERRGSEGRAGRGRHVPRRRRRAARALGRTHRHRDRARPGGCRPGIGGVRRDERGAPRAAPTSCSSTPPGGSTRR